MLGLDAWVVYVPNGTGPLEAAFPSVLVANKVLRNSLVRPRAYLVARHPRMITRIA